MRGLQLAGRGTESIRPPTSGQVTILGEVEEAAGFIRSLSVFLYPVTRGSGMKVKVLEALACGVPVVTTPEGADGIGAHDGIVVETTDERLAAAAAELLGDPVARKDRGAAARRLFQERFTPGVATQPLVSAYERMVRRGYG
ncbi:MAG: glycosyltransferase [Gaiella sp.]|nr:glycosyltransferase [Gaiella sp.]